MSKRDTLEKVIGKKEKLKKQKQKLAEKAASLKKLNQQVEVKNDQLQELSNKLEKYLTRQVYTNIFEGKKGVKKVM